MGVYYCVGCCVVCRKNFMFNPHRVPSIRIDGVRREVCRDCFDVANAKRKKLGVEPHKILAGAYEPAEEGELE